MCSRLLLAGHASGSSSKRGGEALDLHANVAVVWLVWLLERPNQKVGIAEMISVTKIWLRYALEKSNEAGKRRLVCARFLGQ